MAVEETASSGQTSGFERDAEMVYQTLPGVVTSANGNAAKLVLKELKLILDDRTVEEHLTAVFPYLYTAGFLAFIGKEINRENMARVLTAVGIQPKEEIANMLLETKVRNNIIYLYTLYFLMVMGKEINEENMFKILAAIGEPTNDEAAKDILVMYNNKQIP